MPGRERMSPTVATLYALLHRGTPGDLAFYRSICAGGSRVVELGAGAGRIALALAERGHDVTALDHEPALIELAAERSRSLPSDVRSRLRLVLGDMRAFDLGERFDRVIVPYNTLCCFLDRGALEEVFRRVRAHLEPDGLFAFDVYRGDPDDVVDDEEDLLVRIAHQGRAWNVFERALPHDDPYRADTRYRFLAEDGEAQQLVIAQRLLPDDEIFDSLDAAGLVVQRAAGGFAGEPLTEDAPQLVVVAAPAPRT